jgi:hypothetical protein
VLPLRLALFDDPAGVDAAGHDAVVVDLRAGAAPAAPARVGGPALRWALVGGDAPGALPAGPPDAGRPDSRATIFLEQPVRA